MHSKLPDTELKRRRRQQKRHKIPAASNFIELIPSRLIHQMLPFFLFWILILKNCIKVQEKKKKVVVLCSRTRQDVKIGTFTYL